MEVIDVAITVALTCFGFVVGFAARGLFAEGEGEEWAAVESRANQYEPPRPVERL